MATAAKKRASPGNRPTPAQLAARKAFAAAAKAGTLQKGAALKTGKMRKGAKKYAESMRSGQMAAVKRAGVKKVYIVESSDDKKNWLFDSVYAYADRAKQECKQFAEMYDDVYWRVRDESVT